MDNVEKRVRRKKRKDRREKIRKRVEVCAVIVRMSLIRETSGPLARQPKRVIIDRGR